MSQLPEVDVCQEPALPSASGKPASIAAGTTCRTPSGVCITPRQAGQTGSATTAAAAAAALLAAMLSVALLAAIWSVALLAAIRSVGEPVGGVCNEAVSVTVGGWCWAGSAGNQQAMGGAGDDTVLALLALH